MKDSLVAYKAIAVTCWITGFVTFVLCMITGRPEFNYVSLASWVPYFYCYYKINFGKANNAR